MNVILFSEDIIPVSNHNCFCCAAFRFLVERASNACSFDSPDTADDISFKLFAFNNPVAPSIITRVFEILFITDCTSLKSFIHVLNVILFFDAV